MKKQNLKNQKGITLIALVVTIVVLLILAGVSISMVLGNNGLITKATDAKAKTEQDAINTEKAMNSLYDELVELVGGESNDDDEYCEECGELLDEYHYYCEICGGCLNVCGGDHRGYCSECGELLDECICDDDEDVEEGEDYCPNCGLSWDECLCCPYCGADDGHYEYCDICGDCLAFCNGEHEICETCGEYDIYCVCE